VTLLEEKDLAVIRSILGRAAIFDAHHRLAYAALVAVFVAYAASGRLHIATHAIVTWNAFAICSLVLAWNTIVRADLKHIQRTAQSQDSDGPSYSSSSSWLRS
jgi:uncharacterized membrane protein